MKVAILGAGPAGLMAALAVERNGHEPVILAGGRSKVNPDMFLQRPLPEITGEPDGTIFYQYKGTRAGYAAKCYGSPAAPVHAFDGPVDGHLWWLQEVYDQLWYRYASAVVSISIDAELIATISQRYGVVLSTLPAPAICLREHNFDSMVTWLVRYESAYDRRTPNYMIWSGQQPNPCWFRMSLLRSWYSWEYAIDPREHALHELSKDATIVQGSKMIGNNCDCHPKVSRIGRWAQWQRGILNHHAYEQTTAILASEGLGKGV